MDLLSSQRAFLRAVWSVSENTLLPTHSGEVNALLGWKLHAFDEASQSLIEAGYLLSPTESFLQLTPLGLELARSLTIRP